MHWLNAIAWGNHCDKPIKSSKFLYWPCWKAFDKVVCTFVVSLILFYLANESKLKKKKESDLHG
jgi:hypothetical protein